MPSPPPTPTEKSPISIDWRAPLGIAGSTARPNGPVPMRCPTPGGRRTSPPRMSVGLNGASAWGNSAAAATSATQSQDSHVLICCPTRPVIPSNRADPRGAWTGLTQAAGIGFAGDAAEEDGARDDEDDDDGDGDDGVGSGSA